MSELIKFVLFYFNMVIPHDSENVGVGEPEPFREYEFSELNTPPDTLRGFAITDITHCFHNPGH